MTATKTRKSREVKQVGLCYVITVTTRYATITAQAKTEGQARALVALINMNHHDFKQVQIHRLRGLTGRELILIMR